MDRLVFYGRALWRYLVLGVFPRARAGRDAFFPAEKRNIWKGEVELAAFLASAIESQGVAARVDEIARFAGVILPLARLPFSRRCYLEVSYLTGRPGFGIGVANFARDTARAFLGFLEREGCARDVIDLCRSIARPFGSNMLEVRAEFFRDEPTRYTFFPGRWLDPPASPRAYDAILSGLPELERVRPWMDFFAPEYFFPYLGLSFRTDGAREIKVYPSRFDRGFRAFDPGTRGRALLERMGLPEVEIERTRAFYERVRPSCACGYLQIGTAIDESGEPRRANVLLGAAPLEVYRAALEEIGIGKEARDALVTFGHDLRTDEADFLSIRLTPEGVGDHVKVYRMDSFGRDWDKDLRAALAESARTMETPRP